MGMRCAMKTTLRRCSIMGKPLEGKAVSFTRMLVTAIVFLGASAAMAIDAPAPITCKTARGAEGERPAIRDFVTTIQRDLHSSLSLPYPAEGACEIVVEIGFAAPSSREVGHRLLRMPPGTIRAVVAVPKDDAAYADEIRFSVAAAVFRSLLHSRVAEGQKATEPPEWFVRGMAALTDRPRRAALFEETYSAWSHASLDEASVLLERPPPRGCSAAVASQIVAWCIDRPDARQRWSKLLDALASGEKWSSSLLEGIFLDLDGFDADEVANASFDQWMANQTNHILSPGTTHPGVLSRIGMLLEVFPDEIKAGFDGEASLPLSFFAHHPEMDGAQALLLKRAARFRAVAIGRDDLFRHLCLLYARALETSAMKGWFHASALWLAAEDMRAELGARTAAGEILGLGK